MRVLKNINSVNGIKYYSLTSLVGTGRKMKKINKRKKVRREKVLTNTPVCENELWSMISMLLC